MMCQVRDHSQLKIHGLKRWLECRGCINENNIVIEEAEEVVIQSAIQEDVKSHRCILRLKPQMK